MKTIQIAPDLKLPLDTVLLKKAILAKSGAGKSNTAAAIVEETLDAKVPIVIIDPKGDWWGLKSSADGKSAGYPILIFGGDHADVPLDPASGALMAEFLVESGQSAILDVSDFSKKNLYQFVGDFATAFYTAKKKSPTAVLLVIEEADEVAPQKLPPAVYGPAPAICLSAIEKIVKRGRFLGIGTLVITQRSASLNKDVLTQTDMLILMRTTAPQDVDAVDAWIEHHPDQKRRQEVLATIQSLKDGEGYVWCPALDMFQRTTFHRRRTFDSGRTPKIGEVRAEPKVLAKADIEALKGRMASLIEKAKADDPAALRAQIRELQKTLVSRVEVVADERIVEVPVLKPDERELLEEIASVLDRDQEGSRQTIQLAEHRIEQVGEISTRIAGVLGLIQQSVDERKHLPPGEKKAPTTSPSHPPPPSKYAALAKKSGFSIEAVRTVAEGLSGPQQRILDAIAWFEAIGITAPDKVAVAFVAGYKPGGGAYNNPLGQLRNQDGKHPWPALIEYQNGSIVFTKDGRKRANKQAGPSSVSDLHDMVLGRLDGPEQRILEPLLKSYPRPLGKDELAAKSGYSQGGGAFNNPLGRLRSLGLIDYPNRGQVVALPVLFPVTLA